MKVTMSWANISEESKANVKDVLDSGWLSRHKYIPRFETAIAKLNGAKRGVFLNSGTDALRISLLTLKEVHGWHDGDEVIIPGLTFVATANAVFQSGLVPIFADVQIETGNIEPSQIASLCTPLTRAVIVVHLFGLPVFMPAVMQIANQRGLRVIEDSCEAIGTHVLAGDMACFSFYVSHHIQCGVGGMITTNFPHYERVARSYMNHGRTDDGSHFEFSRIGYSSRATEMEAALGCGALKHFDRDLKKRQLLAKRYWDNHTSVEVHKLMPFDKQPSSWMFYPILISGLQIDATGKRDRLLKYLRKHGIESREAMPLLNQPCYKGMYKKGSCPNAERWTDNGLLLPLHPLMDEKQVDYVCKTVRRFFE